MNNQELIDKAVEVWLGIYKPAYDYVERFELSGSYTASLEDEGSTLFAKSKFTQRAKELGWINGYKWGVEYPTNGKKPELPDDVVVVVKFSPSDIVWHKDFVQNWRWLAGGITSFRIVDERYKPKAEIVSADNSWHERGEFPPAGIECEVNFKHKWYKTKIVGMNDEFCVFDCRNFSDALYEGYDDPSVFRPIKTERERFVDAAFLAIRSMGVVIYEEDAPYLSALYDSGFRAPE